MLGALALIASAVMQGYTPQDTLDDLSTRRPIVQCIVRGEVGRAIQRNGIYYPAYDPYMPGSQGEQGTVQLHPRGLLPLFYARGFTDPHNPTQAHDFLEQALDMGLGLHWSTYRSCI